MQRDLVPEALETLKILDLRKNSLTQEELDLCFTEHVGYHLQTVHFKSLRLILMNPEHVTLIKKSNFPMEIVGFEFPKA